MDPCKKDFKRLLTGFKIDGLDRHAGAVYGVLADMRLACFNKAWFAFAAANEGGEVVAAEWGPGRKITDAFPAALRTFYEQGYQQALQSMKPWTNEYECSSPKLYRTFHQKAYPLGKGEGLLIVNSLKVEQPHSDTGREASLLLADAYKDKNGLYHQCCHCRRMRHVDNTDRWDWVPALVKNQPEQTSHGLCSICADFYYRQKMRTDS